MNQYQKVAFYTLGCKLNFSETSTIARLFEDAGFAKVDFHDQPDVFVINTCSVTQNADKECKKLVSKAMKINPQAFVIIIGCYAQLKPDEIAAIPGVDLVLGANEKFNVLAHLESTSKKEVTEVHNQEVKTATQFFPAYSMGDRTRTFFKVQDGCDYFCSFCTIPLARGFSRSASVKDTLLKAKEVLSSGVREIVLTGVNLGDFGAGTDENFFDLLKALTPLSDRVRYRISSIEPNLLSTQIVDWVASHRQIVPHFHIPMQSGSDTVLQKMRRRYDTDLYRNRIAYIKEKLPRACIGVDVIVGYPGETDDCFEETYRFIQSLDVSYLHVFTYSERDNTPAIRRTEEVVPKNVRSERSKKLHILSEKLKRAFYADQVGQRGWALMEAEEDMGFMYGFTENYIKVRLPFDPQLVNQLVEVEHLEVLPDLTMKSNLVNVLDYQPVNTAS